MDIRLLPEADRLLSKCGRPLVGPGRNIVPIPYGILVQGTCANNSTNTLTKEIPGDVPFVIQAIQTTFSSGLYFNIQLPTGRYLFNVAQDVQQFDGFGSTSYPTVRGIECPPGSKIIVTMDASVLHLGSTQAFQLLFEGAYQFLMESKEETRAIEQYMSALPRYWGHGNQNILAPMWYYGFGPRTPDGCDDDRYRYFSQGVSIDVAAGPYSAVDTIAIQESSDFIARRVLIDTRFTSTAQGTFLGRIRAGSGYALQDDLIDMGQYINGAPWAHDWPIRAGEKLLVDLQLVDFTGTGFASITVILDGVRRKKKRAA